MGVSRDASLFHALTSTDRLSDLLPVLHQHAVAAVAGHSSILYQFNRAGDALQATSAFRVQHLPATPWPRRQVPDAMLGAPVPRFVRDASRLIRGVPESLGTLAAVFVPLSHMREPRGVLIIGCDAPPSPRQLALALSAGQAFVIALERARADAELDLQSQLRQLLQAFSRDVSSTTLSAGLETLCMGVNRLFDADRTSVWLHDRRSRTLALSASSDVVYLAHERSVAASDTLAPPAVGLRRDRAGVVPSNASAADAAATLMIPLKGRRRALGAIVMDEVRYEPGAQMEMLERADEIGRQLSGAIENVLLLDTVLRSRRELENTFNSLADLVAVSDREGRLVFMNAAFLERSGRPRQELIDAPLVDSVGPATRRLLRQVADGHGERRVVSAELEDAALHGTFHVTLAPLVGEERESMGVVLVARDVAPHAQFEAERTELRSRLVQSEKLAALGQFVAGIAHELNNPLQGVLGHLELMRATGAFPKGLRRDMQRIYREADRAAKIVRNLLVFAGARRLVRKRTNLNTMLARVLALRAPALRAAGIEVVRSHAEGLPRIAGDPLLLHQAFLNIVMNAEQAIGIDGRIETHTTLHRRDTTQEVVVHIRDTGPGIAPEAMPRLFEPFYTTKEVGKGTGLGLAISYGIIQDHGGQIAAANHPDGGAVFTVRLPVQ
jgi:PAS domain S-box-containing protein